jgi:hypothetical protein
MRTMTVRAAAALLLCNLAFADTFTERWYLAGGGIAQGPNSFADRGPGPDRLPYTSDDVVLPADGNRGGTWSFGCIDVDSDGTDEHVFCLVRRNDDDAFTLTTSSDFSHGVIAEGETWVDLHHSRNEGPSGQVPDDDDFEWNDSPNWESQSNWLWYNNIQADQRGLGGSIYYFEYRDPLAAPELAFDEVQNWRWNFRLNNNADNGTGIQGYWGDLAELVVKGLFIPVDAIPQLKDGDLDKLFGWQDVDMAAYMRDTLYPKLIDDNLAIFINSEGGNGCDAASVLPPAFVMLIQAEGTIVVTDAFKAEYWGISLDQNAMFRWSSIYIKGDGPDNPPIDLTPADGRLLTLWRRDSFVRENRGEWGLLETGTSACPDHCWDFVDDGTEDCQADYALMLPANSGPQNTYLGLPIGWDLDGQKGTIIARASVALEAPEAEGNRIELILARGDEPIAWAALKSGQKPRLGIGGNKLADTAGTIVNPLEQSEGTDAVALNAVGDGYSQLELSFAPRTKLLTLRIDGDAVHGFTYAGELSSHADKLWLYAQSEGELTGVTVDELAILQGFGESAQPTFRRADANADGQVNIADAIAALTYLFAHGPLSCLDTADANDDGQVNIADAIFTLSYLFASGAQPLPPGPTSCGVDPTADSPQPGGDLGCQTYGKCP